MGSHMVSYTNHHRLDRPLYGDVNQSGPVTIDDFLAVRNNLPHSVSLSGGTGMTQGLSMSSASAVTPAAQKGRGRKISRAETS